MEIQTYNKDNVPSTHGTYKVGVIQNVSYDELVIALGEPTFNESSADGKTQVEWVVEYNGDVFTIYDWKTYDRNYTMNELTTWSVGGTRTPFALIRSIYRKINIHNFMDETKRMDITQEELENFLHKKYDTLQDYSVNIDNLNTYINGKIDTN